MQTSIRLECIGATGVDKTETNCGGSGSRLEIFVNGFFRYSDRYIANVIIYVTHTRSLKPLQYYFLWTV